jgi:hypothetical protein
MAKKQETYINAELQWAEQKLKEWRGYIDDNPINQLEDRVIERATPKGVTSLISATIESQVKSIRDTMKEYLQLLEVVDRLREKEEVKKEARGKAGVPHRMQ